MIQWLQKNNKSLTVFLVIGAVVLAMSFFGVDMGSGRAQSAALKINEESYTFQDFQKERRTKQQAIAEQYKKILGDNFNQYADQLLNIKDQQVVDDLIAQSLTKQEAKKLNLYVGPDELKNVIRSEVFGGNFDPNLYAAYLTRNGMSSKGFEETVRQNELLQNYRSILKDVSKPSEREIRNAIEADATKYDLRYLEFDPVNFVNDVKTPEDSVLQAYYDERQTDYENPAQISYEYAVLAPQKYKSAVPISDDDVELYYSDNESAYKTAEEAKLKHIQITLPPGADEKVKAELRVKAEEAHAKALAGDNFDLLVAQYSDDLTTTGKNGELGWVKPGVKDKRFDEAVFGLKTTGVTQLVSTDYGFHIVKVEEYMPAGTKKLADVKDAILEELRTKEAPAFTSAKANEIYDAWIKSKSEFAEVAKQNDLLVEKPNITMSETIDPSPEFNGLSKMVMASADLKQQIVELGDKSILVNITSYKEARIPPFSEIKEKVTLDYKRSEAVKNAEKTANIALENKDNLAIEELAKKYAVKIQEEKKFGKDTEKKGIFMDDQLSGELPNITSEKSFIKKVFKIGGRYFVFQVAAIIKPSTQDLEKNKEAKAKAVAEESTNILVNSNIYRLKSTADIYVEPSLLVSGN